MGEPVEYEYLIHYSGLENENLYRDIRRFSIAERDGQYYLDEMTVHYLKLINEDFNLKQKMRKKNQKKLISTSNVKEMEKAYVYHYLSNAMVREIKLEESTPSISLYLDHLICLFYPLTIFRSLMITQYLAIKNLKPQKKIELLNYYTYMGGVMNQDVYDEYYPQVQMVSALGRAFMDINQGMKVRMANNLQVNLREEGADKLHGAFFNVLDRETAHAFDGTNQDLNLTVSLMLNMITHWNGNRFAGELFKTKFNYFEMEQNEKMPKDPYNMFTKDRRFKYTVNYPYELIEKKNKINISGVGKETNYIIFKIDRLNGINSLSDDEINRRIKLKLNFTGDANNIAAYTVLTETILTGGNRTYKYETYFRLKQIRNVTKQSGGGFKVGDKIHHRDFRTNAIYKGETEDGSHEIQFNGNNKTKIVKTLDRLEKIEENKKPEEYEETPDMPRIVNDIQYYKFSNGKITELKESGKDSMKMFTENLGLAYMIIYDNKPYDNISGEEEGEGKGEGEEEGEEY